MANTTNFAVEKPTPGGYRNTWGGTLNTGFDKLTELLALALPLGTIQMYPLTTAPTSTANGGEWLVCKGQSLVRATYPDLHTLITNKYGTYPDGDTFLLPDLQARVAIGYNVAATSAGRTTNTLAEAGGTETHTLLPAEIAKHLHTIVDTGHVHPIADQTHFHVGNESGGKTATASAVISDPQHDHESISRVTNWQGGSAFAETQTAQGLAVAALRTDSNSTGITDSGHAHSFQTDTKSANISTTGTNTSGFTTATVNQADGNGPHQNMQPYLVVNYIILAKHPTF